MKILWNKNSENENLATALRGATGNCGSHFLFQSSPEEDLPPLNDFANTNEQIDETAYNTQSQVRITLKEQGSVDSARHDNNLTTPGSLEGFFLSENNTRLLNPLRQLRVIFMPKSIMRQRVNAGLEIGNRATGAGTIGRYSDIESRLDDVAGDDTFRFIQSGGNRGRMNGASLHALEGIEGQIKTIQQILAKDIKIGEAQNAKSSSSGTFMSKVKRFALSPLRTKVQEKMNLWNSKRLKKTADNLLKNAIKSKEVLGHKIQQLATNTSAYQHGLTPESRNENANAITFQDFINDVVNDPTGFLAGNGAVFNGYNFEIVTGTTNRRWTLDMIRLYHAPKVVEAEETRAADQDLVDVMGINNRTNANVAGEVAGITRIPSDILNQLPSSTENLEESREIKEKSFVEDIVDNITRIYGLDVAYQPPNPQFNINNVVFAGSEGELTNKGKLAYLFNYMQNTLNAGFLLQFDQETTNDIHMYIKNAKVESKNDILSVAELAKLKTNSSELILSARNALTSCNVLDTYFPVANQADLIPIGLPPIEKFIKDFNELEVKELIEKIEPKKDRGVFQNFLNKMTNYASKLEKVVKDARGGIKDPPVAINSAIIPSEVKLVPGDAIERYLNHLEDPTNPDRIETFSLPSSAMRGQDINNIIRRKLSAGHSKKAAENFTEKLSDNAEKQWNYLTKHGEQGDIVSPINFCSINGHSVLTPDVMTPTLDNVQITKNRGNNIILQGDATDNHVYMLAKYDKHKNPTKEVRLYRWPRVGGIDDVQTTSSLDGAEEFAALSLPAAA